ncbi:MAG: hypothetical protein WDN69_21575 [Aliidongia sp.]
MEIDTSAGKPSELCWLAVSPDDSTVYATNFGYSNLSTYRINGSELSVVKDPACPRVPGDGTFRGLNGTVGAGPSDSWITPNGAYLYQIYGNASKLVGYATQPDGSLVEITSVKIPYNSPQGPRRLLILISRSSDLPRDLGASGFAGSPWRGTVRQAPPAVGRLWPDRTRRGRKGHPHHGCLSAVPYSYPVPAHRRRRDCRSRACQYVGAASPVEIGLNPA